ncbi:MAG TPA: hypothetical protein VLL76_10945 [Candidatus Omnitrophota bacterium]|nr:hypothetical protein [Candidatus Omnitrophota bacterium]
MKKTILAALLGCTLAMPAAAQSLEKAWETTGFANPESVLWDGVAKVLYVSNVNGSPMDKDGNGYISKLSADGKVLAEKWVTGLDAPKGMAVFNGRLYISDVDRVVVVDTKTGKITKTHAAAGAKFLNDVTEDDQGTIYVSDMLDSAIWRLKSGKLEKWLANPSLEAPNGLKVDKGRLVIASWGPMTGDGFKTSKPGNLKAVSINDTMIRDLGPGFGNLDGLEPDGKGGWLVSDWLNGGVFRTDRQGQATRILSLDQGSADIGVIPEQKLLLVPMMMHAKVVAYKLP